MLMCPHMRDRKKHQHCTAMRADAGAVVGPPLDRAFPIDGEDVSGRSATVSTPRPGGDLHVVTLSFPLCACGARPEVWA
ncbi:hypothetical protein Ani05nite_18300 [Amorphoplanes nipponensis]|uniref:Uncharacterized protein n=1 Tax=Actinoplanes nipponensis TaxID=135950 RepID=A0A919JDA4_9ACTN|nr:hypothetical protein Ani05nite_18300 [Actinoplanes nipponensis]